MRTSSPEPSTATRRVMTRSGGVRKVGLLVCLLALACAPSAHAADRLVIRGAGFGHGIGMSQYGAYGYAKHGFAYDEILRHYYSETTLAQVSPAPVVRVLLRTGSSAATFTNAARIGRDAAARHDLQRRQGRRG